MNPEYDSRTEKHLQLQIMGSALTAVFFIFNFCKQSHPDRIKKCLVISPLQENMEQTVSWLFI